MRSVFLVLLVLVLDLTGCKRVQRSVQGLLAPCVQQYNDCLNEANNCMQNYNDTIEHHAAGQDMRLFYNLCVSAQNNCIENHNQCVQE